MESKINKKILLILLIISLLPFLRSCADVSYGFPTVSINSENPLEFQEYTPSGFIINFLFVIFTFIIIINLFNHKLLKNDYVRGGLYSLLVYHIIYILSFTIYILAHGMPEFLAGVLMSIIYPTIFLLGEVSFLEFTSAPLFPDVMDFKFRLSYILSILIYFMLGILIVHIIKKRINKNKNKK